jgi:hypothetical protein
MLDLRQVTESGPTWEEPSFAPSNMFGRGAVNASTCYTEKKELPDAS